MCTQARVFICHPKYTRMDVDPREYRHDDRCSADGRASPSPRRTASPGSDVARRPLRTANRMIPPEQEMEGEVRTWAESLVVTLDELECKICYNRYDARGRKPKLLACLHRVCAKCLKRMVDVGESSPPAVSCPFCRHETLVPEEEVWLMEDDRHILAVLSCQDRARRGGGRHGEVLLSPDSLTGVLQLSPRGHLPADDGAHVAGRGSGQPGAVHAAPAGGLRPLPLSVPRAPGGARRSLPGRRRRSHRVRRRRLGRVRRDLERADEHLAGASRSAANRRRAETSHDVGKKKDKSRNFGHTVNIRCAPNADLCVAASATLLA
ncbi:uncharacterized protein LOC133408742 isoform X1 [Phycodurus eques]|uniref:uncharacterized protein LOC133408742 isoform X1 n=3 Tax=Phycodurus eques TaxID=693459 RepID=UPI002ACD780B|nr:uncharacterized protein LOC133408742 isoform X1 [Phycodurus eques]XP_061543908.1 uncharacterized protein LOC133408742 isoform X1 [Phycodurus eques]XP_061543910.1 uncharacterized protein LOC133408742 isoform X1 [Phycodurus eques]XP_061543912.1 uncharacterized protein LOC133408742 isoform X1 [Phycodurus eques]